MQRRENAPEPSAGAARPNPKEASDRFSELSGFQRAAALADDGSLSELSSLGPQSPIWVGAARIADQPVLLALTDGHVRGGTVGVKEAGVITRLLAEGAHREITAVVVCWDTGGVRVEEGPVALATASAVGVAIARLTLVGPRVVSVISGPRGCFGAPSVIAALSTRTIITAGAHWGLTGPKLLRVGSEPADEQSGWQSVSAAHRKSFGHADHLAPDSAKAIRRQLIRFVSQDRPPVSVVRALGASLKRTRKLLAAVEPKQPARLSQPARGPTRQERDLLRFSFRGHWRPTSPVLRRALVHAAWGLLDERPALGIVVGSDRAAIGGLGVEDANAITEMVHLAVKESKRERAPILTFVFCQGHAIDLEQERAGLHRALAETLKTLVGARLLGHPLLCVLGGSAYGAAYLSLAAPSHRILAIRGTTVAPMAPDVLAAFRRLRGMRSAPRTPSDLAELIPEIRMVNNIIRLPSILHHEVEVLRQTIRPEPLDASRGPRRKAR